MTDDKHVPTILIADDDAAIRTVLSQALTRAGHVVRVTSNSETLCRWVLAGEGDAVISDVMMPDGNAFEFLPSEDGSVMDIEAEVDLSVTDLDESTLEKICDLFFAEEAEIEYIDESRAKIVFKRSKGEIAKKKKCAKGMRLVGNRCLPQTGTQKSKERRKGIKLKRAFKAMGAGKKKKAQIKKKITKRRTAGRARNLANTEN